MMAKLGRTILIVYSGLIVLFLALPMIIIAGVSFGSTNYATFPPEDPSLEWYVDITSDPYWVDSFLLSGMIALVAALGSVILAFALSMVLVRSRIRFKRVLYTLVLLPLIIPKLVTAVALYDMYAYAERVPMIIAGHVIVAISTAVIILSATVRGVDRNLERAAWTMGASPARVLVKITLPLAAPGLIAAFLLSFLASFDEFFIGLFFSSPEVVTLPIRIYTSLTQQVSPGVAAVSTVLIVMVALILLLMVVFNRSASQKGAPGRSGLPLGAGK